nr:hypothetical protein [Mucilaginibacter sp. L294]
MEFLNRKATIIFSKLIDSLKGGDHRSIENDPFMPLTVERLSAGINTPWGNADIYSLCHYYEQQGDLMQDPEVCFLMTDERRRFEVDYNKVKVAPISFQQANSGIFQRSVLIENYTITKFKTEQQKDHTVFANDWLINIVSQGFLEKIRNEK